MIVVADQRLTLRTLLVLVLLALGVTLLNACKPLTVDDPYYAEFAHHVQQSPLDPFGFRLTDGRAAMDSLTPLVIPYWLAAARWMFGAQPWLWKLTFLPFALLLVFSLYALASRFTSTRTGGSTLAMPLVWMLVCSPMLLPGWNLMLDLPVQALGLTAVVLYLRGQERFSVRSSNPGVVGYIELVGAGLLVGLAMQTKYTALVLPAVFLVHGLCCWREGIRVGLRSVLVVALAVLVFLSWEGWLYSLYGQSHFFHQLTRYSGSSWRKIRLGLPLVATLGGVAPWLALFALIACWRRRVAMLIGAGAVLLVVDYLLIGWLPLLGDFVSIAPERIAYPLVNAVFGFWGLAVCGLTCVGAWYLVRQPGCTITAQEQQRYQTAGWEWRDNWFLVGWLVLEVLGYFALSPFPAVRRVLGLGIVATLLVGRWVALTNPPWRSRLVWSVAAISILMGLGYQGLDLLEARARKKAVTDMVQHVRRVDPKSTIWIVANHSVPYYSKHFGVKLATTRARFQPGDWLVTDGLFLEVVDGWAKLGFPLAHRGEVVIEDPFPWRTLINYYGSGLPVRHQNGPRVKITMFQFPSNWPVAPHPLAE